MTLALRFDGKPFKGSLAISAEILSNLGFAKKLRVPTFPNWLMESGTVVNAWWESLSFISFLSPKMAGGIVPSELKWKGKVLLVEICEPDRVFYLRPSKV